MSNVFLVSKPLHIIVAQIIHGQLNDAATSEFVVVNGFSGARDVAERICMYGDNLKAVFVDSAADAYRYLSRIKYNNLFIDSDVGFKKHCYLAKLKLRNPMGIISVYEEGLGSYRNDLYRGSRRFLLNSIGAGTYFGGNVFVNTVYLFDPARYRDAHGFSKEIVSLEYDLETFYSANPEKYTSLFGFQSAFEEICKAARGNECTIYLQGWDYDGSGIDALARTSAFRVLKPHPHRVHQVNDSIVCDFLVGPQVPAELLLVLLSKIFAHITVLHHGSSAENYIRANNVKFVALSKTVKFSF